MNPQQRRVNNVQHVCSTMQEFAEVLEMAEAALYNRVAQRGADSQRCLNASVQPDETFMPSKEKRKRPSLRWPAHR